MIFYVTIRPGNHHTSPETIVMPQPGLCELDRARVIYGPEIDRVYSPNPTVPIARIKLSEQQARLLGDAFAKADEITVIMKPSEIKSMVVWDLARDNPTSTECLANPVINTSDLMDKLLKEKS